MEFHNLWFRMKCYKIQQTASLNIRSQQNVLGLIKLNTYIRGYTIVVYFMHLLKRSTSEPCFYIHVILVAYSSITLLLKFRQTKWGSLRAVQWHKTTTCIWNLYKRWSRSDKRYIYLHVHLVTLFLSLFFRHMQFLQQFQNYKLFTLS